MNRAEYIASWLADVLFQGGGDLGKLTKGEAREAMAEALPQAEATWPEFERELARMQACDAVGGTCT